MTLTDLVINALAVWQTIELFRHGSVFSGVRSDLKARSRRESMLAYLLLCPFCLSPWVALAVVLLSHIPGAEPLRIFVFAAAVSRLANLGNDLAYSYTRSPASDLKTDDDSVALAIVNDV